MWYPNLQGTTFNFIEESYDLIHNSYRYEYSTGRICIKEKHVTDIQVSVYIYIT